MRDADRLKEKIEVSLDNRQIFFLFFGSAVVACLVFVVGVMVGKRLEARKARTARPSSDELALVDRDSKVAAPRLTFHDELVKPDARAQKDVPPEVLDWQNMGRRDHRAEDALALTDGVPPASEGGHRAPGARTGASAGAERGQDGSSAGAVAAAEPAKKIPTRRYTLQVSAYQSKADADQMVKKLQQAGFRPYIVSASVPNRGVWFRVRVGSYSSLEQASDAKGKFEEKLNLAAYVSRK